jgi:sec-independent protein translocase protein TatB
VVALVVLGPERLPGAARTAGALLRRLRNGWASVRDEVENELHAEEFKRNLRDVQDQVRETESRARENFRATGDALHDKADDGAPKEPPP